MTVEEGIAEKKDEEEKKRTVLVGIRIDRNDQLLLNWALVKVAEPGDRVVAIHVCRDSDKGSEENPSLEDYLEIYKGLCNVKQLDLTGQVSRGSSVRKVLVREAKLYDAVAVIVGIRRQNSLGCWISMAKYCAKRLPSSTTVLAIHNGKIVFKRGFTNHSSGSKGDPRPSLYPIQSLYLKEKKTSFDASEAPKIDILSPNVVQNYDDGSKKGASDTKHDKFDVDRNHRKPVSSSLISLFRKELQEPRPDNFGVDQEYRKPVSSSLISLFRKDMPEPRPGWPLLRRAASATPETFKESEARKISVVQWVMSLPNRSPSNFGSNKTEVPFERDIVDFANRSCLSSWGEVPKELELLLRTNSSSCRWFSYKELKKATSQFSSETLIGNGGCGSVYKGWFPDGKMVAVKLLKLSKEAWKDFILEVDIISSLNHKHIIPLIGVCLNDNDLILVYDFLSKGSLEENLHGKKEKSVLPWEVRFNVAVGVAEAINYLHKECSRPVIHRDVKSSNILLSDEFEPQLSDFGLATWAPTSSSYEIHSDVVGTFGYLAPEYFMFGKVSNKIDVYSYGVVLLELLSGRKPISTETPKGQESLVLWAKPMLESGNIMGILDPNLVGKIDEVQMRRMVLVITLCITRTARLRPQMDQILRLLQGEKDIEEWVNSHVSDQEESDNPDGDDMYPESSVESHPGVAMLDVDDDTMSFSSVEQSNHHSLEDYLKGRWSRSSSFD